MSVSYHPVSKFRVSCLAIAMYLIPASTGSAAGPDGGWVRTLKPVLSVADLSVQSLAVPRDPPEWLSIEIVIDGLPVTLDLQRHSVRGPGFRVRMETDEGSLREIAAPPVRTYRGSTNGAPAGTVAASLIGGQLFATIQVEGVGRWYVQPLSWLVTGIEPNWHVVYRDADIVPGDWTCGAKADAMEQPSVPVSSPSGLPTNAALALDADWEYYQLNGSSVVATVADIEGIVNAVEAIYDAEVNITYGISEIIVRTNSGDPYSQTNCSLLLEQFRNHWNANHADVIRDAAHLMTGRDLDGNVIGCAYVGVMCEGGGMGYGLSQSQFTGNFGLRTALTTHELGHNWGASHCSSPPPCSTFDADCAVMCACIGGCSGSISTFGASATAQISAQRDSVVCVGSTCQVAVCNVTVVADIEECPDGIVQSGDGADVFLGLVNVGQVECDDLGASLGPFDHPGVFLSNPPDTITFPDLPPGTGQCVTDAQDWDIETIPSLPPGTYCADILVTTSDSPDPFVIPNGLCLDVGPQPWMTVTPEDHDFGVMGTNEQVLVNAQVHSAGTAPWTVSGINHVLGPQIASCTVTPPPETWGPAGDGVMTPGYVQNIAISLVSSTTQGFTAAEVIVDPVESNVCFDGPQDRITITGLVSDGPVIFTVPGALSSDRPDVSGDRIVWEQGDDIFVYDIAEGTTTNLTADAACQRLAFIDGNIVVWGEDLDCNFQDNLEVIAHDLAFGQDFIVAQTSADEQPVGVEGNWIAFVRAYDSNPEGDLAYNMFVYRIADREEIQITFYQPGGPNDNLESVDTNDESVDLGGGTLAWYDQTITPDGSFTNYQLLKVQFQPGSCSPCPTHSAPAQVSCFPLDLASHLSADNCRIAVEDRLPGQQDQIFLWSNCVGQCMQITFDPDFDRQRPALCGNYLVHTRNLNPDWLMYTDLTTMNEHIIAQEAEFEPNNDGARCAGSLAAWAQRFTDVIYFTYLGVPEIALQAADIDVSPPEPFDVDPIEISVTVHNLAPWNATDVILVQVFDGDPGMGGVPLCEVPIAGLPARSDDTVTCTVGPLAAGLHDICARAVAVVDGHPGNNEACTTIEVLATGACCLPGGSCNITTKPTDCFDDGGTWLGPGSGCPPRGCPVTIGSCCLGDNVCVNDLNADECAAMGGLYAGNATSCVDHPPVCCPWDCQADPSGAVDINDLLDLLASWGDEGPCDFDGGAVSITDLLELLANWGACP